MTGPVIHTSAGERRQVGNVTISTTTVVTVTNIEDCVVIAGDTVASALCQIKKQKGEHFDNDQYRRSFK